VDGATISRSLIADGCTIGKGSVIENSVIGLRFNIGENVTIRNSVLMGADYFQSHDDIAADKAKGIPPIGIGNNTTIDGAIVDKNCRIGNGVTIRNEKNVETAPETPQAVVCDHIVVIPKGTTLEDGWKLA
jgi:glucose-1-phosphate adenylyltransferase